MAVPDWGLASALVRVLELVLGLMHLALRYGSV